MLAKLKIWSAVALLGVVVLTAAAQQPEPKAGAEDDSKWLLSDAEMFVKFNFKQMFGADLMTKGGTAKMKEAIKGNEQLKSILDMTELDLAKDLDSIVMTASGSSAKDAKALIVVRGKFNQTKLHDAMKKAAEKNEKLKLVKEGTTQLYEIVAQDNSMYAAFADKNTFVVTQSKDSTVDAVKNGGKKAATVSKEMKAAMGRFNGKESMTMALVINEDLKKMLNDIPNVGAAASKLKTVTASITLTSDVVVGAAGTTGEAKSAKQLSNILDALKNTGALAVGGMEGIPPIVGELLDAIKVSAGKDSVNIDLKVTKDMIEKAGKGGVK